MLSHFESTCLQHFRVLDNFSQSRLHSFVEICTSLEPPFRNDQNALPQLCKLKYPSVTTVLLIILITIGMYHIIDTPWYVKYVVHWF